MAHVRRKFTDLLKIDPKNETAKKVVHLIARLYRIETEAREAKLCPEKRRAGRQAKSLPLMEKLEKELLEIKSREFPSSMLAKACNYTLGQWKKLASYWQRKAGPKIAPSSRFLKPVNGLKLISENIFLMFFPNWEIGPYTELLNGPQISWARPNT